MMKASLADEQMRLDFISTINAACGIASYDSLSPKMAGWDHTPPATAIGSSRLIRAITRQNCQRVSTAHPQLRRTRSSLSNPYEKPPMQFTDSIALSSSIKAASLSYSQETQGTTKESEQRVSPIRLAPIDKLIGHQDSLIVKQSANQRRAATTGMNLRNSSFTLSADQTNWFDDSKYPQFHQAPECLHKFEKSISRRTEAKRSLLSRRRQRLGKKLVRSSGGQNILKIEKRKAHRQLIRMRKQISQKEKKQKLLMKQKNREVTIRVALKSHQNPVNDRQSPPPFPYILLTSKGKPLTSLSLCSWHIGTSSLSLAPISDTCSVSLTCLDVSSTDVSSASLVNVLPFLQNLQDLKLNECHNLDELTLSQLADCSLPKLSKLSLNGSPRALGSMDKNPDDVIPLLDFLNAHGVNLEHLNLSATAISDPGLISISLHAPNLKYLNISNNKQSFSNSGVHYCLCRLATLRDLDVSKNSNISGRCALLDITAFNGDEAEVQGTGTINDSLATQNPEFKPSTGFNEGPAPFSLVVEKLNLSELLQLSSRSVQIFSLACGKTLRILDLTGCSGVTDAACRSIAEYCAPLQDLSLCRCAEITSMGVGMLCNDEKLPSLERLNLTGLYRVRDVFLSTMLARSNLLLRLSRLELSQTSISDEGLKQVALRLVSGTVNSSKESLMSYEFAFEEKFKQIRLKKARSLAEQRERMYAKAVRQAYEAGDWVLAHAARQKAEDLVPTYVDDSTKAVEHIDLRGCSAVTISSLCLILTMGDNLIKLVSLDIRGCSASLQRAGHKVAAMCSETLKIFKLGFPLSSVVRMSKSTKSWKKPVPPQGPTDKVLRAIIRDCRKLETLVVHACQQIEGASDVFRYKEEKSMRRRYRKCRQKERGFEPYHIENDEDNDFDHLFGYQYDTESIESDLSSFVDEIWDEETKSWVPENSFSFFDPNGSIQTLDSAPRRFSWCPEPHPCLTCLDVSGCTSIDEDGLSRILSRLPHVRSVMARYTPATSALEYFRKQRLHASPLIGLHQRQTSSKWMTANVIGFSPDDGYENRGKWWFEFDTISRASRRIQQGWHEWWSYTKKKRGATKIQSFFRGSRTRLRFWRKRERAQRKRAEKEATAMMQRMGRGFCGRRVAAKRRKQVHTVETLFGKQLFSQMERRWQIWQQNAKIQKCARILRERVFDRERFGRMRRFWDLWQEGIVKQVKACMTIQNSLLRVGLAVRERNRRRAQRRWDIRFDALVRLQSWWRGYRARFRLLVQRFKMMPCNLLFRARLSFQGGIGWKSLGLIPNKDGGAHKAYDIEVANGHGNELGSEILEMRIPDNSDPKQLLSEPLKLKKLDRNRINDALEYERRGISGWFDAIEGWKECTGALLRKGELTNDFELHVLERLMALERSRGEFFKCAELHKRAKRVCTNMLRAVQDYGHRKHEIYDRLYLYKRRRQLLIEFLRYRIAYPKLLDPDRITCENDRSRRIDWWSVRQAMRQLGRAYEDKRAKQVELVETKYVDWKNLSEKSVKARAEWLQKDKDYRMAHATLVGSGELGIGEYMLSSVVHGGYDDHNPEAKTRIPVASSASSMRNLGSNRFYLLAEAARVKREKAREENDALACALEQKTIELEVARSRLSGVMEGIRRCNAKSIFALTLRRDGHEIMNKILKNVK